MLLAVATPTGTSLRWHGPVPPNTKSIEILRGGEQGKLNPVKQITDPEVTAYLDREADPTKKYRYNLRLHDAAGKAQMPAEERWVWPDQFLARVNCGGKRVESEDGIAWEDDSRQLPDSRRWVVNQTIEGVPRPWQRVYQSERWSSGDLRFEVDIEPPGRFLIVLHLAETNRQFHKAGKRVMDIHIDGKRHHADVDVFAEVGGDRPLLLTSELETIDPQVVILLSSKKLGPSLKGIEILEMPFDARP